MEEGRRNLRGESEKRVAEDGSATGGRRWRSRGEDGAERDVSSGEEGVSSSRRAVSSSRRAVSSSRRTVSEEEDLYELPPLRQEVEDVTSGGEFGRKYEKKSGRTSEKVSERVSLDSASDFPLDDSLVSDVDRSSGTTSHSEEPWEDDYLEHPMLHQATGRVSSLDSDLFSWLESMIVCVAFAVIFGTFFGNATQVSGSSMDPTLEDGQLLFLWNMGYSPEVGDIVVLNKPTVEYLEGVSIVKRVVALGGDRVVVDYTANQVYVNGVALEEDYTLERMRPIYGHEVSEEVLVPEGSVYVLGDNRNHSADSRYDEIGTVDVGYILGEAVLSLYPFSTMGFF